MNEHYKVNTSFFPKLIFEPNKNPTLKKYNKTNPYFNPTKNYIKKQNVDKQWYKALICFGKYRIISF